MPNYCVNSNAQPTGEREVHDTAKYCLHRPNDCRPLGWHADCYGAVAAARRLYNNVDGCAFCTPECHTR